MQRLWSSLFAVLFLVGCQTTPGQSSERGDVTLPAGAAQPRPSGSSWRVLCPEITPKGTGSSLTFSLQHAHRESGRDSHSTRLSAQFDGQILTLYGPYGTCTRGMCEHREVAFVPSDDEVAAIRDMLQAHDLWEGWREIASTDFQGPGVGMTSVTEVALKLTDGERTASSEVVFGRAGGSQMLQTGSEGARQRAEAVRLVLMALRETALRCFPDFRTG